MKWDELAQTPNVVQNYEMLRTSGILDAIEEYRSVNASLESLLQEAYEIFRQESVDKLIDLIIRYLSEKFIPSSMLFVLNEGIMINRIKILAYRNMKGVELPEELNRIDTLEPFEHFFRTYTGSTSFLIMEEELGATGCLDPFRNFRPEIAVPVLGISGLYGMILFGPKILGEEYNTREIAYIDRLIRFTSIAIQNTIHYEHSVKDSKTGLYNHNFFSNRISEQTARSRRSQTPFSVIVLDIDRFKKFNDSYGHLAGDEVIINLASTLKKTVREGDIVSRFGGEEFTVLLPAAGSSEAYMASERIREAVQMMETRYQGNLLKVTVSLGIATFNPYEKSGDLNLLKRADKALYQSKKNGRNRSTLFRSGLLHKAGGLERKARN